MPQFRVFVHDMDNKPLVGASVDMAVDDYFNPADIQVRTIALTDTNGMVSMSIPDYYGKNWGCTSRQIGYKTTSKGGTDFGNNDINIDLGMGEGIDWGDMTSIIIAIIVVIILTIIIILLIIYSAKWFNWQLDVTKEVITKVV